MRSLDHAAGHQALNPYGAASTPRDLFQVTAEDEAEDRKLRAKYRGGAFFRSDADTADLVTHLRSQQMDHQTEWCPEHGDL